MRGYQTTKGDGGGIVSTEGYCGEYYAKRSVVPFSVNGNNNKYYIGQIVTLIEENKTVDSTFDYTTSIVVSSETTNTVNSNKYYNPIYATIGIDTSVRLVDDFNTITTVINLQEYNNTVDAKSYQSSNLEIVEISITDPINRSFSGQILKELGKWQTQ